MSNESYQPRIELTEEERRQLVKDKAKIKRRRFDPEELRAAAFQKYLTRQELGEEGSPIEDFKLGKEELKALGSLEEVIAAETYIRESYRPNTE